MLRYQDPDGKQLFTLKDVTVEFGDRKILDCVTWHVGDRDRVGLIGANGSGKSTLLRVAADRQTSNSGDVLKPNDLTIGYLPQDVMRVTGTPLWDHILEGHDEILEAERELQLIEDLLAQTDLPAERMDKLLSRYGRAQEHFERIGGYRLETEAARILTGLGFSKERWHEVTEHWSGGWQARIALARLLVRCPGALLLDEPTNYLDLENIQWLESFLADYKGSVAVVSHDRVFLDKVTNRTTEVVGGRLEEYAGNYGFFLDQRELRTAQQEAAAKNQQKRAAEIERFVSRFRYKASKARQVQSRVKMLEKMEQENPGISAPKRLTKTMTLRFPPPQRSGKEVVRARQLEKSYGDVHVFSGAKFNIIRGDRVALVGLNGAGKSTLIRLMMSQEQPDGGKMKIGHNVCRAYVAQDHADNLVGSGTVLDEMLEGAPPEVRARVRDILGAFLFSGDDVDKPVRVLSGGEKTRLGLAKMICSTSNFLLMDEPTNHLDIASKEILADALRAYEGTVAFVSHDRHFLRQVATKMIEIADGAVTEFPWPYADYEWYVAEERREESARTAS